MTRLKHLSFLERAFRRFRKDDAGGATVEAVLWLPMFIVFFVLVAEVSFVFFRQTQILTVLQDGNRALSVGRLATATAVEDFVEVRLASLTSNATIVTSITGGVVTTQIQVPVDDLVAVGMFSFLADYNIGVTSQQFIEF